MFNNAKLINFRGGEVKQIVRVRDNVIIYQKEEELSDNYIEIEFTGQTLSQYDSDTLIGSDIIIDYDDGNVVAYEGDYSHTYTTSGDYTIKIYGVTSLKVSCFRNCTGLTSINIPDSITNLGVSCFRNCTDLTSISIPDSVISLGNFCFEDCTNLIEVVLNWSTSDTIVTYNSNWIDTNANLKFIIPIGTTSLYLEKGYPSELLQEKVAIEEAEFLEINASKQQLSFANNDQCTITITVLNELEAPIRNAIVRLYKEDVLWDTLYTDINGECSKTYNSTGIGDITFEATCGHLTKSLLIKDYLWIPPLDGTDQITSWTDMTNTTSNGIFQSHGSFLTEGWPNNILWQLDFDVSVNTIDRWRYVGLMPVCASEINPFTDAKAPTLAMTTWEGITFPNNMGLSSWDEQDSMSKITDSSWHHITIIKLSSTKVKTIIDNTYTAIGNYDNLPNHSILHIGTRDNPYNTAYRNTGGIISMKNITVKIYTGD